jgi:hypothetical protein
VNHIHSTEDGLIYSRATKLAAGRVMARHWGRDLHGGRTLGSVPAARKYLIDSFSQMYPEHTCDGACGEAREPDNRESASVTPRAPAVAPPPPKEPASRRPVRARVLS